MATWFQALLGKMFLTVTCGVAGLSQPAGPEGGEAHELDEGKPSVGHAKMVSKGSRGRGRGRGRQATKIGG